MNLVTIHEVIIQLEEEIRIIKNLIDEIKKEIDETV